MGFDFIMLAAAFGGGIFGAATGGIISFILCGILATIGSAAAYASGNNIFNEVIAWGPYFGPHIGFAGGVAAAAYAATVGKLDSGRNVAVPLIGLNAPDVLLVGGIFGALGYVWTWVTATFLPCIGVWPWMHPVVFSVAVNNIMVRLLFGKTGLFGRVEPGKSRWLPSENAQWLIWQETPPQLLLIGLAVSLPTAFVMIKIPAILDFSFAVTAFCILFLAVGFKMPIVPHIGFSAGLGAVLLGSFWWGVTLGVLAAFIGEFLAAAMLNHGDTHIDPPLMAVFVIWLITVTAATYGAGNLADLTVAIIGLAVNAVCYFAMTGLKSGRNKVNLPI